MFGNVMGWRSMIASTPNFRISGHGATHQRYAKVWLISVGLGAQSNNVPRLDMKFKTWHPNTTVCEGLLGRLFSLFHLVHVTLSCAHISLLYTCFYKLYSPLKVPTYPNHLSKCAFKTKVGLYENIKGSISSRLEIY